MSWLKPQLKKTLRAEHVDVTRYPDGQTHVNLARSVREVDEVRLVWRLRNNDELVLLMQISDALDAIGARKRHLVIPYLLGARSDRPTRPGDSADLKVVARCVNACGWERVHLFDAHSDVATQVIDRSVNYDNRVLVAQYDRPDAVLVCPDAGAAKKVPQLLEWNANLKHVVYCVKSRSPTDGEIKLRVLEPEKCFSRHCVIVDDLCDGGATFLAIAKQIETYLSLTLIVTHGIFSKGLDALFEKFDYVITSDSYREEWLDHESLTVVCLDYARMI